MKKLVLTITFLTTAMLYSQSAKPKSEPKTKSESNGYQYEFTREYDNPYFNTGVPQINIGGGDKLVIFESQIILLSNERFLRTFYLLEPESCLCFFLTETSPFDKSGDYKHNPITVNSIACERLMYKKDFAKNYNKSCRGNQ